MCEWLSREGGEQVYQQHFIVRKYLVEEGYLVIWMSYLNHSCNFRRLDFPRTIRCLLKIGHADNAIPQTLII